MAERDFWPCCPCCDLFYPDGCPDENMHTSPCEEGCNDGV
jgi:hypothetical protein